MENISLKNILLIMLGGAGGYFTGQIAGGLLGTIVWAFAGLALGGLAYQATSTVIITAVLSIAFGILLAFLAWNLDKGLFGGKMPFLMWAATGAIIGTIVMFTYGIHIISNPESYGNFNGLNPIYEEIFDINRTYYDEPYQPPWYLSLMYYGGGTGQLIGIYLGIFSGLLISIRETIGSKRTTQDKKEFDEYSDFFKKHLKK